MLGHLQPAAAVVGVDLAVEDGSEAESDWSECTLAVGDGPEFGSDRAECTQLELQLLGAQSDGLMTEMPDMIQGWQEAHLAVGCPWCQRLQM